MLFDVVLLIMNSVVVLLFGSQQQRSKIWISLDRVEGIFFSIIQSNQQIFVIVSYLIRIFSLLCRVIVNFVTLKLSKRFHFDQEIASIVSFEIAERDKFVHYSTVNRLKSRFNLLSEKSLTRVATVDMLIRQIFDKILSNQECELFVVDHDFFIVWNRTILRI